MKFSDLKSLEDFRAFHDGFCGMNCGEYSAEYCILPQEIENFENTVKNGLGFSGEKIYLEDGVTHAIAVGDEKQDIKINTNDYYIEFVKGFNDGFNMIKQKIDDGVLSDNRIFDGAVGTYGEFRGLPTYKVKIVDGVRRWTISKKDFYDNGLNRGQMMAYLCDFIDNPRTFFPDEIETVKNVEPITNEIQDSFKVPDKYIDEIRKNFIENEIESNLTEVTHACMCADFYKYGHKGKRGEKNNTGVLCMIIRDVYYKMQNDNWEYANNWRDRVCESMGYDWRTVQNKAGKV